MRWAAGLCWVALLPWDVTAATPRNVLYMVFDDLRPDLSMYGSEFMATPSLQKLADTGITFERAYCQQSVCSPSRMSFTTGRRPNTTKTWNFLTHFRQAQCPSTNRVRVRGGTPLLGTRLPNGVSFGGLQVGLSGGAGQCCTDCTAMAGSGCKGWSISLGNCTLWAEVDATEPCQPWETGCLHGTPGSFPKWTPLPQNLQRQGILTLGVGKYFHDVNRGLGVIGDVRYPGGTGLPPQADPVSWSNVSVQNVNLTRSQEIYGKHDQLFKGSEYTGGVGFGYVNSMDGCSGKNTENKSREFCNAGDTGVAKDGSGAVPPLCDYIAYKDVKSKLAFAKKHVDATGKGFFLAVGIRRPHLTWRAPQQFVNLYPFEEVTLPKQLVLDKSIDPIAWSQFGNLNGDEPYVLNNSHSEIKQFRAGYYAAVSWADFVAGQVLDELKRHGLTESTAVVVHSDHGWHLGEYNMWEKRTLWENANRVPLIVRVPWLPAASAGTRASALVELVDVYPTVCELLGVELPTDDAYPVEGSSLMPLLLNPTTGEGWGKAVAMSTYPRCPQVGLPDWESNSCIHSTERADFAYMGYSIRVDMPEGTSYRFTEWFKWVGASLRPNITVVKATELYNHSTAQALGNSSEFDLHENVNLAATADPALVERLRARLRKEFELA